MHTRVGAVVWHADGLRGEKEMRLVGTCRKEIRDDGQSIASSYSIG